MLHNLLIFLATLLISGGSLIILTVITVQGFKKLLATEGQEKLFPLRIHGSRVMLTAAEYEAHVEDQNNQD